MQTMMKALMVLRLLMTSMVVIVTASCSRREAEPQLTRPGQFIYWNAEEWKTWFHHTGYTEVLTRHDGMASDLVARKSLSEQVLVNFLADGVLGNLMVANIQPGVSIEAAFESAKACLDVTERLDPVLAAGFAHILENDMRAALLLNTTAYRWQNTEYFLSISTGNKFVVTHRTQL